MINFDWTKPNKLNFSALRWNKVLIKLSKYATWTIRAMSSTSRKGHHMKKDNNNITSGKGEKKNWQKKIISKVIWLLVILLQNVNLHRIWGKKINLHLFAVSLSKTTYHEQQTGGNGKSTIKKLQNTNMANKCSKEKKEEKKGQPVKIWSIPKVGEPAIKHVKVLVLAARSSRGLIWTWSSDWWSCRHTWCWSIFDRWSHTPFSLWFERFEDMNPAIW